MMNLLEISSENNETLPLTPKWKSMHVENRNKSSLLTSLIGGQNNNVESLYHQVDYICAKILNVESRNLIDLL